MRNFSTGTDLTFRLLLLLDAPALDEIRLPHERGDLCRVHLSTAGKNATHGKCSPSRPPGGLVRLHRHPHALRSPVWFRSGAGGFHRRWCWLAPRVPGHRPAPEYGARIRASWDYRTSMRRARYSCTASGSTSTPKPGPAGTAIRPSSGLGSIFCRMTASRNGLSV